MLCQLTLLFNPLSSIKLVAAQEKISFQVDESGLREIF
jgi:hypothetical protein